MIDKLGDKLENIEKIWKISSPNLKTITGTTKGRLIRRPFEYGGGYFD